MSTLIATFNTLKRNIDLKCVHRLKPKVAAYAKEIKYTSKLKEYLKKYDNAFV